MDGSDFDRLSRRWAGIVSRRGVLAAIGGLAAGLARQPARAAQPGPPTCGSQGDVCTLLLGCCSGFTCVTSAINTSYGICVPGEGGMVAASTSLISPFSPELQQEIATTDLSAATADAAAVDPQAEREARIAERKARQDARKNKRETRQNELDLRRDDQQEKRDLRRTNRRANQELALGPQLELELFNAGGKNAAGQDAIETVRVTNLGDVSILLTQFASLSEPDKGLKFPNAQRLDVGEDFLFLSQPQVVEDPNDNRIGWRANAACSADDPGDGFELTVAFSENAENHRFVIHCDQTSVSTVTPGDSSRRRRRKKKSQRKQNASKRRARNKNG